MIIECPECNGEGIVKCGHQSHWIDTMSSCHDPLCIDGWIPCELCDGEGTIENIKE